MFDRDQDAILQQERYHQQRNNVEDLDHRVNSRSGSVLVRIADGVTGDGSFVGIAALAAQMTVFNVFFGIVPGRPAGGHGDGQEKTGDDTADQQSAQGDFAQNQSHQD